MAEEMKPKAPCMACCLEADIRTDASLEEERAIADVDEKRQDWADFLFKMAKFLKKYNCTCE